MKTSLTSLALLGSLVVAPLALAQERIDHFEALPSETLEEAVANFKTHNDHLAAILEKDELVLDDLNAVHQLTYTLEVALEKIHTELAAVADVLEEVHVASETGDFDGVKANGERYLEVARTVVD